MYKMPLYELVHQETEEKKFSTQEQNQHVISTITKHFTPDLTSIYLHTRTHLLHAFPDYS